MMNPPPNEAAISVIWDVKNCPVYDEDDARRVSPCIKGYLRNLGYTGPITITAVGVLSDLDVKVLEAVYSSGISLYNVPYGCQDIIPFIHVCIRQSPPPPNIMVISRPLNYSIFTDYLSKNGYNIILPFPSDSTKADVNHFWDNLLLKEPEENKCSETGKPALWVCAVCDNLAGELFESFIEHISTPEHEDELIQWFPPISYASLKAVEADVDYYDVDYFLEAVEGKSPSGSGSGDKCNNTRGRGGGYNNRGRGGGGSTKEAAISVIWDVKMCPVYRKDHARRVSPGIKGYLRNLGYTGPITITAVGVLSDLDVKILEAVYSSGISLYNGPFGRQDIDAVLSEFMREENPPPANIIVISRPNISSYTHYLSEKGYNVIVSPFPSDSTEADVKRLWKKLVLADPDDDGKCSETGEPASWVCAVCHKLTGEFFESFIEHISTPEHEHERIQWFPPIEYASLVDW